MRTIINASSPSPVRWSRSRGMVMDLVALDRILHEEVVARFDGPPPEPRRAGVRLWADAADVRGHRRPRLSRVAARLPAGVALERVRIAGGPDALCRCTGPADRPASASACVGPRPRRRLHVARGDRSGKPGAAPRRRRRRSMPPDRARVAEILRSARRDRRGGAEPQARTAQPRRRQLSAAGRLHDHPGPADRARNSGRAGAARTSAPPPPAGPIDIVDIFRRSEFVPALLDDLLTVRPRLVWMQVGVRDDATARRLEAAGIPS